jgi:hypothetical protein
MSWKIAYLAPRVELAIALTSSVIATFVFVAAPAFMGPMFDAGPPWLHGGVALAGTLGTWFGTWLMWRIWWRGPEAAPSAWRYRRDGT